MFEDIQQVEADPASAIEKMEVADASTDDTNESPPSDIVAYNELRSCADIYRMHTEEILEIQPEFQRDFVWKPMDQTRFVDSLIKQLPIPSMCFAYDFKQNKWMVIDGLQRISTIIRFLGGDDWKLADLSDIDPHLSGKNARDIKSGKGGLKHFYTRVQNQTLPINVLRCDFGKKQHNEYLFTIFHRLNSGGSKLNNQEIRNCIYSGRFNDLLKTLDRNADWRRVNRMRGDNRYRFTKQEWILRLFAFLDDTEGKYKGSVSSFLNDYMFDHRWDSEAALQSKRALFERTMAVIAGKIFLGVEEPPRMPGTVLEAIMVGVARNLEHLERSAPDHVRPLYEQMRAHESISDASLAEGLSKPDKVKARFDAATAIFAQ